MTHLAKISRSKATPGKSHSAIAKHCQTSLKYTIVTPILRKRNLEGQNSKQTTYAKARHAQSSLQNLIKTVLFQRVLS